MQHIYHLSHNYSSTATESQQIKAMQICHQISRYKNTGISLNFQKAENTLTTIMRNIDDIMQSKMSQPQKDRLYEMYKAITLLETGKSGALKVLSNGKNW